jgi:hypothetical protein
MRAVSERHNPEVNAISRLAYRIAGSSREYYALPQADRRQVRDTARLMYNRGQDIITSSVYEKVDKRGFVYVITNPAWPGSVKVGRAFDPEARLRNYQTSCPNRDFKLHFAAYFNDCYAAELMIHSTLADYLATGEWFHVLPSTARAVIERLGGYE